MKKTASAAEFAGEQARTRCKQLAAAIEAALATPDAEAVHALRVAIRRLEPSLDVFGHYGSDKKGKKIRRRLLEILALAGEVRDCDVALELLSNRRLCAKIFTRRERAASRLLAELKRHGAAQEAIAWRPPIHARSIRTRSISTTARRELRRAEARFLKSGRRAVLSAKDLHRVRIAAKRLRYLIELFADLYGPAAEEWLAKIRKVQSLLGRLNNCRTVRAMVSDLGGPKSIARELKKKQRQYQARFGKLWRKEFRSRLFPAAFRSIRQ